MHQKYIYQASKLTQEILPPESYAFFAAFSELAV